MESRMPGLSRGQWMGCIRDAGRADALAGMTRDQVTAFSAVPLQECCRDDRHPVALLAGLSQGLRAFTRAWNDGV